MSVDYNQATRTARMTAVVDKVDEGTPPGTLEIGSTGWVETIVILTLANPCGTVSNDRLTLDFDPDISNTAAATGVAAVARIKNNAGTVVVDGLTVNTAAADIILDSVNIDSGQTVTVQTGYIDHYT